MKKRFISMCLLILVTAALLAPTAQAAYAHNEIFSSVEILDNGVTIETTLIVHASNGTPRSTSSKSATRNDVYKYNGTEIATISLTAKFGYNGTSSWVNSSSVSKSVANGWTYSGESLTNFGGTATVTATLSKLFTPNVNVNTSITCSPAGAIS